MIYRGHSEAYWVAHERCPEHPMLRLGSCPWKHTTKHNTRAPRKAGEVTTKHECSENTTVIKSKDWLSYSCTCGLNWGYATISLRAH